MTLGDHIRKCRLDLGLFQKQVAEQIGVDTTTIWNWECHKSSPQMHQLPEIIRFLGYNPLPPWKSFPERLLLARRALGLTQKIMAGKLGVDPTTIRHCERGTRRPSRKLLAAFRDFVCGVKGRHWHNIATATGLA
jgi:transcriptional regulator with XRE-family HTH domain